MWGCDPYIFKKERFLPRTEQVWESFWCEEWAFWEWEKFELVEWIKLLTPRFSTKMDFTKKNFLYKISLYDWIPSKYKSNFQMHRSHHVASKGPKHFSPFSTRIMKTMYLFNVDFSRRWDCLARLLIRILLIPDLIKFSLWLNFFKGSKFDQKLPSFKQNSDPWILPYHP